MSNLILTGFSGAGKSAVGRAAAALLGWSFVDVDAEVVHRTGKPVAAVFAEQGEAAFRRLEAEALIRGLQPRRGGHRHGRRRHRRRCEP